MHAMVTARVPQEIRDQVNAQLRAIGSSPTELVNAAYDYVLKTGKLPDPNDDDAPLCITLTEAQEHELRFRLQHVTRAVPPSFWARNGVACTEKGR